MPKQTTPKLPKQILNDWCEKNNVSIGQFAKDIHADYQHGWNILRGSYPINRNVLANILIYYGKDGPALEIAEAMKNEFVSLYQQKPERVLVNPN